MIAARAIRRTFVLFLSLLAAVPAAAQQTGEMQREGHRHERWRAARRDGGSACRRVAVAARRRHRSGGGISPAGAAAGKLHGHVHAFRHADRDPPGAGAAWPGHGRRCRDGRAGAERDRHRHRDGVAHRARFGVAQERRVERADHVAAGRAGVSRSAEADSRCAVLAGYGTRAERRRQRPGQRLQLRRRQRHAAAVRHARFRAFVARHRAGHHRPRRRARRRLRSVGRLRHRLGQQVGHQSLLRRAVLAGDDPGHGGGAPAHQRVALRTGPQLVHRQRRRAADSQQAELLRLVLPAAEHPGESRQPLWRAAELRTHP